jgi:hypothetical protein
MRERNLTLKGANTPLEKGKTKEGWGEEMDTILIKKINTNKTIIGLKKGSMDPRKTLMITSLYVSPTPFLPPCS